MSSELFSFLLLVTAASPNERGEELPTELPPLGGHFIGDYRPIHLPEVGALHSRARRSRHRRNGRGHEPFELTFSAFGRDIRLSLQNNANQVFHPDLAIHIHQGGEQRVLGVGDIDTSVFYGGHVNGDPHNSAIRAHVDVGGVLVGELHTPHGKYYIERADRYLPDANFSNIIYRREDLTPNTTSAFHGNGAAFEEMMAVQEAREAAEAEARRDRAARGEPEREHHYRRRRAAERFNITKHNTCFMAMVADHTYVRADAGGDPERAIVKLTQTLAGATLIYSYTDFTNVGTGLIFAIRRFQIFADEADSLNPFNDPGHIACGEEFAATTSACVSTQPCYQPYLNRLGEWGGGSKPFDDVCLAHAFTHRDFCGGVLGLAWIGRSSVSGPGICAQTRGHGGFTNTGFTSTLNYGTSTSLAVQVITLSHELGHNFGAPHDEPSMTAMVGDEKVSCTPGTTEGSPHPEKGNYLMYYKATDGDDERNTQFSPCSRDLIGEVITTKGPLCFETVSYELCGINYLPVGSQFCGDGVIADNEDCDCGTDDPDECAKIDPCCTVDCILADGAECSPLKDSTCCSQECQMYGLSFETTLDLYKQYGDDHAELANQYRKAYIDSGLELIDNDDDGDIDNIPVCAGESTCFPQRYCIADRTFRGACPPEDFVYQPGLESNKQSICYDFGCDVQGRDGECVTEVSDIPSCFEGAGFNADCYMFHASTKKLCNDGRNYCRFAGCVGSLCSAWPATDVDGEIPSAAFLQANPDATAEKCRLSPNTVEGNGKECHVSCKWAADGKCFSTETYAATAHGQWINNQTIVGELKYPQLELYEKTTGSSCYYKDDPFGGRCNYQGEEGERELVCMSASTAVTEELSPEKVARWIEDHWSEVLGISIGGIILMFLLKYTYKRKEPQLKRVVRTFKNKTYKNTRAPRDRHTAAGHPKTSVEHMRLRKKQKLSEAVKRLGTFFPGAKRDNVDIKGIVKQVENERQAVKKLLAMGYGFRVPNTVPLLIR